jgi:aspartokinase
VKFIILKFGGTSLTSDDLRMRSFQVIETSTGFVPVVVVSAIAAWRPYATDTLLSLR